VVRLTARAQLSQNISMGFNGKPPDPLPISNYLSGSVDSTTPVSTSVAPIPGPVPGNQPEGWRCGLVYPAMNRPK
jgi:hypothetical protein